MGLTNHIEFHVGNGQTIGYRKCQSNYFSTVNMKKGLFIVLADGTIDSVNGRRAAMIAVESMIEYFRRNEEKLISPQELFQSGAYESARQIDESIYLGRKPHVSLLCICFNKEEFYWYAIGSVKLFVVLRNNIFEVASRFGKRKVKDQEMLLLCSKGVTDSLSPVELLHHVYHSKSPYERAQEIIDHVVGKKDKNQNNATVILIDCR